MATIEERIIKCVKYRFPHDTIQMETKFREDLGGDSLAMLEFVMDLEDEFGVNISSSHIDRVSTVGDIVSMLTDWNDKVMDSAE
jgi:acyl carrier protein